MGARVPGWKIPLSNLKRVDVWYSLQSDYCYFLIDRLLTLPSKGVAVVLRPVLGLVLRMPELTENRGELEQRYFVTDAQRTAAFLGLPYCYPDPSPIQFEPGSLWIASSEGRRAAGANQVGRFDEFDTEGRFVGQVSLAADFDPERDTYFLRDVYLFIIKEGQNEPSSFGTYGGSAFLNMGSGSEDEEDEEALPLQVICYRIGE